jgi:amino acid transporter
VDNPSRTFPRALLWAVLLVVASYFLPTLAALGVTVDSSDWELGYYGKVAQQVCVAIRVFWWSGFQGPGHTLVWLALQGGQQWACTRQHGTA